jgi:hypothetical protein
MNLPILPREGVNDLLLGSLLSADLKTLVFTDSHPSESPQIYNKNQMCIHFSVYHTALDRKSKSTTSRPQKYIEEFNNSRGKSNVSNDLA